MPGKHPSDESAATHAERTSGPDPADPEQVNACQTSDEKASLHAPIAGAEATFAESEPASTDPPPAPATHKQKVRAGTKRKAEGIPTAPKRLAMPAQGKSQRREWFARIRIREDRLARLWVSNLASHDIVVWSNKEKRWVAMLAVAELRRALESAELELKRKRRSGHSSANPSVPVRMPGSLPPAPPLAMLHAAAAGVGELRLRSIAQNPGALTIGVGGNNATYRSTASPHLPHSKKAFASPANRTRNRQFLAQSGPSRTPRRSHHWHWRAMERVLWIASGVLAMFVVSGSGSAGEKPAQPEAPPVLLMADQYDRARPESVQSGLEPSFGQQLMGPKRECPVRPSYCQPPPNSAESELHPEEYVTRETAQPTRSRLQADPPSRTPAVSSSRPASEGPASQPDVPGNLNFPAVRAALFTAAAVARTCPGESVGGRVVVTFEPAGSVRYVDIPLLIGDHPDRDCILRSFRNVRIPAFNGHAVAVKKDF